MPASKKSYAIPCASEFRDHVQSLAAQRGVNVGDLARSVMLVVPPGAIEGMDDPGEPAADDRETVVLKSGPSAGKPWRRKPRLQVRLPHGHSVKELRKALNLALAMAAGERNIRVELNGTPDAEEKLGEVEKEVDRLRGIVGALSFKPLPQGVKTRGDAMYVLGFPLNAKLGPDLVKSRFRMLASIHHPDSAYGDTRRMSQLNQAMAKLRALGIYR
ncbi:MAG: J domain-containing protein [Alphaproteobacteria bacterium]|nr:J domain-containing protein [Alphaproteobacteria bacterium]